MARYDADEKMSFAVEKITDMTPELGCCGNWVGGWVFRLKKH